MSQKAWMNAYTKGSKEMQARLAQVHAKNPEFQAFLAKHGFGGNLSVKHEKPLMVEKDELDFEKFSEVIVFRH
jgi:hypothetical protein